jgi:glyoxylase-like metal-dependent hydrolase (beta-lactamase superfamily II)
VTAPPTVEAFHDRATGTVSYVVHAGPGTPCAVIDPVLDFDLKSGRTKTSALDRLAGFIERERLAVEWILETHIHADHLTGAPALQQRFGGRIAIGAGVREVQRTFAGLFNLGPDFPVDGSQFDHLFQDGERFRIGALEGEIFATPGHTPACVAYRIGDAVFAGDTIFMPDGGTARCDFPGGDARTLYRSIRRILALPPETRLFVCHDYGPGGRDPGWATTIGEQRAANIHVKDGIDEESFAQMRTTRDKTLDLPALLVAAVQVNIRAGRLPPPEANGVAYLKIPVNAL